MPSSTNWPASCRASSSSNTVEIEPAPLLSKSYGSRSLQPGLLATGAASGAKLLFRLRRTQRLPREQNLPDASYPFTLYRNQSDRRHGPRGIRVRAVEYALDGIPDPEPSYRLLANWLDPNAAPGAELAALYHRRWTIEQAPDELTTQLADRPVVLRSKIPDLVEQGFYPLLLAHAAIRRLMAQAAANAHQAAEDLSFIYAVRVLKRQLPAVAAFSPWTAPTLDQRLARRNRRRPGRHHPRQAQSPLRVLAGKPVDEAHYVACHGRPPICDRLVRRCMSNDVISFRCPWRSRCRHWQARIFHPPTAPSAHPEG